MIDPQQAIMDRPEVGAAREALRKATARHEDALRIQGEATATLAEANDVLEATVKAGDPEGKVRTLTAARRAALAELEDATEDARAAEAAVKGAAASQHREVLRAIGRLWGETDYGAAAAEFKNAVRTLGAALDRVDEIAATRTRLAAWSSHLSTRLLEGAEPMPSLRLPDLGIPEPAYRELAGAVRRIAGPIIQQVHNDNNEEAA